MVENKRANMFPAFVGAAVLFDIVVVLLAMWGKI